MRLLLLMLLSSSVFAEKQDTIQVSYLGNREYTFQLAFHVPALPEQVFSLLTDFENLDRLNSSIQRSQIVMQSAQSTRVELIAKVCVLFACKELTSVEDVAIIQPLRELYSEAVPSLSKDIEAGHTRWTLQVNAEGTQVLVDSFVRFSFWAPPLIGPYAIKRELRMNVNDTVKNIQKLAESSMGNQ